jgi:cell division protein FtsB
MVDYDSNIAQIEELAIAQQKLSQLETENERLRKEVSLWKAVEDISGMYKLEELKEIARYRGLKGYSSDGKNALLRRLVKEGILTLDITPYL